MTAIDEAIKFVVDALTEGKSPEEIKLLQDDMNRLHAGVQKGIYDMTLVFGLVGVIAAPSAGTAGALLVAPVAGLQGWNIIENMNAVANTTTDGVDNGDFIPFNLRDPERLNPLSVAVAAATNEEDRAFYLRLVKYRTELEEHLADEIGLTSLWESVTNAGQSVMTDILDGQQQSPKDVSDTSRTQNSITRK